MVEVARGPPGSLKKSALVPIPSVMDPHTAPQSRPDPRADGALIPVLIADDDPDIRELLAAYFSRRGHPVAWVKDGRAAIAALESRPGQYGLVVTDLQMPGADGLAVLAAARRSTPSCFVVIVTGYASLDSAVEAVRQGAFDYLTKPFTMGQVDVILDRIADRTALEQRNRALAGQSEARGGSPRDLAAFRDLVSLLSTVNGRLDNLDARLAGLESLVRTLIESRTRT